MIPLLLAAVAVGLGNLAASVAIGVAGVDTRTRLRVAIVFGIFEAGMPVVGLLIGRRLAAELGEDVRWAGAALLIAIGAVSLIRSVREGRQHPDQEPRVPEPAGSGLGRLLLSGLALSMDNLVIGFALGTYGVGILEGALVIGAAGAGRPARPVGRAADRTGERRDPDPGRRGHRRRTRLTSPRAAAPPWGRI